MKDEILSNIDHPEQLEAAYRANKIRFKEEFDALYSTLANHPVADCWHERLNYEEPDITWGSNRELALVVLASLLAGFVAKIPEFLPINDDSFYPRNIGFVVIPLLALYFVGKRQLAHRKIAAIAVALTTALVYINLLPKNSQSDTLTLACIHLPLFLWAVLGFTFVGDKMADYRKRLDFLRYNGDLVVITVLILIAGIVLTFVTLNLFSVIGVSIDEFYMQYVVVLGLAASPIVGTYVIQTNPQLVNKVSPVIARIFSPLVLVTLVVYLMAMLGSGKDPYHDRDFLITFNILLVGVMAIIFFSIAETSWTKQNRTSALIVFLLSIVTVVINGIALSAILFRILEWGITPNRIAVLGGNILILSNLILVTLALFKVLRGQREISVVEQSIATFLPIYSLWTVVVVFLFPVLFGFQ